MLGITCPAVPPPVNTMFRMTVRCLLPPWRPSAGPWTSASVRVVFRLHPSGLTAVSPVMVCPPLPSPCMPRNVEQDADGSQNQRQGGTAGGHQRQRDAGDGQKAGHDADVDDDLHGDHADDADGEQAA